MEARIGRQTPTTSVVLPYEQTLGEEAIKLYESTGRKAQESLIISSAFCISTPF